MKRLLLEGVSGLFKGERYLVSPGLRMCVGRSRSCDISVTRTRAYRQIGGRVLNENKDFLRMSRRHFEISYEQGGAVRVRDFSRNGILVDGQRVREMLISPEDLGRGTIEIRFGNDEVLRLGLADATTSPEESEAHRPLHEMTPSSGFHL